MVQSLKLAPMVRKPLRLFHRLKRKYFNRYIGAKWFRYQLQAANPCRVVIGSSGWHDRGWIPSDIEYLDLLKPGNWATYFEPDSIDCLLAEHVWEHLSPADGATAARTCFRYLRPGGYLRLAVPDGLHPSTEYLSWVKVGGASPGQISNDHRVLYTYRTIRELLESVGFRVKLYEHFDEAGVFHYREWSTSQGTVRRTLRHDPRNNGGSREAFTSIMLDAFKPEHSCTVGRLVIARIESPVSAGAV